VAENKKGPGGFAGSSAKSRKEGLRALLLRRSKHEFTAWCNTEKATFRTLTSLLFDNDPLVIWRAIEAIGWTAEIEAVTNHDKVTKQIRNYFWMMNDESGALCRRSPEAIGEILVRVPSLMYEFGTILTSFLWEEPFEIGTRQAIRRMVSEHSEAAEIFAGCIGDLLKSLEHDDPQLRGYSYLALHELENRAGQFSIEYPVIDSSKVDVYDFKSGELKKVTIPFE